MSARPAVQFTVVVFALLSSASLVSWIVAVCEPDALAGGAHTTGTVPPLTVLTLMFIAHVEVPLQPAPPPNLNQPVLFTNVAAVTFIGPLVPVPLLLMLMFWAVEVVP